MDTKHPGRAEIERLYRRGAITRRQLLAALAGLGLTASSLADLAGAHPGIAEAQDAVARYLVVIVLDAFRPDYMRLAPMPALTSLIHEGVSYDGAWVGQLQSYTPTGHASISTGVMPKRHGVIGFEWRDPKTGKEVFDAWAKEVLVGKLDEDLRASGTDSIPAAIKAADPSATVVAVSSEKPYAADAMGGPAADYILYHGLPQAGPREIVPAAVPGHVPPDSFFNHPHLSIPYPPSHYTDWDWLSSQLSLAAFDAFRPRALMINLPGADIYGHIYGGPATPQVLGKVTRGLDRAIARVVNAYKAAGIYDQTLFVVTADHGMVPNNQTVPPHVIKAAVQRAGGVPFFRTGGTASDIYLHNPSRARAVAQEVAALPGVAAAYYHHGRGGSLSYTRAPGTSLSPALEETYHYLVSTFNIATAPDVVAVFHENTVGSTHIHRYGDHGGLAWGSQHIPLVLRGPGVKQGATSQYPARLIDVAPTVLRLLGLPPAAMDGTILADALAEPTAAEASAQQAGTSRLAAYQGSLMEQSVRDIRWYQRKGIQPPPPGRIAP